MMTDEDIYREYYDFVRPMIVEDYGPNDVVAMREIFNNWTDALCKEGLISDHQYDTLVCPD